MKVNRKKQNLTLKTNKPRTLSEVKLRNIEYNIGDQTRSTIVRNELLYIILRYLKTIRKIVD